MGWGLGTPAANPYQNHCKLTPPPVSVPVLSGLAVRYIGPPPHTHTHTAPVANRYEILLHVPIDLAGYAYSHHHDHAATAPVQVNLVLVSGEIETLWHPLPLWSCTLAEEEQYNIYPVNVTGKPQYLFEKASIDLSRIFASLKEYIGNLTLSVIRER